MGLWDSFSHFHTIPDRKPFFSFCYVNTYWKVLFLVVAARKGCQCQINNTAKIVGTPWRSWIGIVIVNGQKQEGMTISSHLLCCLLCQMAAMLWHISLYGFSKLQWKLEKKIAFTNVYTTRAQQQTGYLQLSFLWEVWKPMGNVVSPLVVTWPAQICCICLIWSTLDYPCHWPLSFKLLTHMTVYIRFRYVKTVSIFSSLRPFWKEKVFFATTISNAYLQQIL